MIKTKKHPFYFFQWFFVDYLQTTKIEIERERERERKKEHSDIKTISNVSILKEKNH